MKRIKHIRFLLIVLFCLLMSGVHISYIRQMEPASAASFPISFLSGQPGQPKYYPFINYTRNYVEWQSNSQVKGFFKKLQHTHKRKFKVLHIGDSHIQADIFTGYIREQMQKSFGAGGRGLIFPYAAAGTHSALDYYSYATGEWTYAKNIQQNPQYDLGLMGITVHTKMPSASFKFVFKPNIIYDNFTTIKLYCLQAEESFDIQLIYSKHEEPIMIDCSRNTGKSYVEVSLPHASDTLEFIVTKTKPQQEFFECYGVMVDSDNDKGIQYNSVGINGAGYKSILKQNLMVEQLEELDPDMVILDLGANDFYMSNLNREQVQQNLVSIINRIREASNKSIIMISNSMDIRCKTDDAAAIFSDITRKTAFAHESMFYDFYHISGSKNSMLNWEADSLTKKDRIHLTKEGYLLKGELYLNGLLNSYQMYISNKNLESFTVNKEDALEQYAIPSGKQEEEKGDTLEESTFSVYPTRSTRNSEHTIIDTVYHQTQEGESLDLIARQYGVAPYQIMKWNNIPDGEEIIANSLLIIYAKRRTNE